MYSNRVSTICNMLNESEGWSAERWLFTFQNSVQAAVILKYSIHFGRIPYSASERLELVRKILPGDLRRSCESSRWVLKMALQDSMRFKRPWASLGCFEPGIMVSSDSVDCSNQRLFIPHSQIPHLHFSNVLILSQAFTRCANSLQTAVSTLLMEEEASGFLRTLPASRNRSRASIAV